MKRLFLLLIFCITCLGYGEAQSSPRSNAAKIKGEAYFKYKKYGEALPFLLDYQKVKPKDLSLKYKIGICFYQIGRLDKAITYLKYALNDRKAKASTNLYLAKAYHQINKYEEAVVYYKLYLATLKDKSPERKDIKLSILHCARGMKVKFQDKLAVVENLGEKINTEFDEMRPMLHIKNKNQLFFSSIREGNRGGKLDLNGKPNSEVGTYKSDLYRASLFRGDWSEITSLGIRYNSIQNEYINGFSEDGQLIYYQKGHNSKESTLYMDSLSFENPNDDSRKLSYPLNSKNWDGDLFLYNDTIALFVSDMPGGYGGKDIYFSVKNEEREWSTPKNLGAEINTPYNEVTPFLSRDGRTIYFSSDNPNSIGGFDVFRSSFTDNNAKWSPAVNLGIPINSSSDDVDFRMTGDGLSAYYSSDRKDGFGGFDMYVAYFRLFRSEDVTTSKPVSFHMVLPVTAGNPVPELDPETNVPKDLISENTAVKDPSKKVKKTYNLAPIFYEEGSDELNPASFQVINRLSALLTDYPQANVLLIGNSNNDSPVPNSLFLSIKQAEAIADNLIIQGVDQKQITLQSCGSSHPIARTINPDTGKESSIGKSLNRRIDISIFNIDDLPIEVKVTSPETSDLLKDPRGKRFVEKNKGLSYRIQINASKRLLNDPILSKFSNAFAETNSDMTYIRYMLGHEKTFEKIYDLLIKIRQENGLEEAYVVAYFNGKRINLAQAKVLAKSYPNLSAYILSKEAQIANEPRTDE